MHLLMPATIALQLQGVSKQRQDFLSAQTMHCYTFSDSVCSDVENFRGADVADICADKNSQYACMYPVISGMLQLTHTPTMSVR